MVRVFKNKEKEPEVDIETDSGRAGALSFHGVIICSVAVDGDLNLRNFDTTSWCCYQGRLCRFV